MVDSAYGFPQDEATGATNEADWDDAAGFAFHEDSPNERDYVVAGLTFDVNWATNTLNISGGKAKFYQQSAQTADHTNDGGPPAKAVEHTTFAFQFPPSGDIGLASNDVTHVFVGINQNENDDYIWQTNTDNTPPSEPQLKLGSIDTAIGNDDGIDYVNRAPAGEFRELTVK